MPNCSLAGSPPNLFSVVMDLRAHVIAYSYETGHLRLSLADICFPFLPDTFAA